MDFDILLIKPPVLWKQKGIKRIKNFQVFNKSYSNCTSAVKTCGSCFKIQRYKIRFIAI